MGEKTHFGYQTVDEDEKASKVAHVFDSVAKKYDVMNDVMSVGLHRYWKKFAVGTCSLPRDPKILDIAGGTGDIALGWLKKAKGEPEVWLTDINYSMLEIGRDRLLDKGFIAPVAVCDAECLPFADGYFDVVSVSFGLRNMTRKEAALREMRRVLKVGGQLLVLEFSKVYEPLRPAYDLYSFKMLPLFGKLIAKDFDSYEYLVESIRMHPDQETLKRMMEEAGFEKTTYHNLTAGVCALHKGFRLS